MPSAAVEAMRHAGTRTDKAVWSSSVLVGLVFGALAMFLGPSTSWRPPGAILVIRLFSEASNDSYYFSPFLLMAVLVGVVVHQRLRWQDWIWPVGAVAWATPRGNSATMTLWWVGEMILPGASATRLLANCGLRFGRVRKRLLPVKNSAPAPISNAMGLARAAGETLWTQ